MAYTPPRFEPPASLSPARSSVPEFPPPPPPPSRTRQLYERFVRWGQFHSPSTSEDALREVAGSISGGAI